MARLQQWRQRLQSDDSFVFKWLARDRAPAPITGILNHDGTRVLTGDQLTNASETFWRQVWPSEPAANMPPQAPGYNRANVPEIPELTGRDLQSTMQKMRKKAAGPDGWSADELQHAPLSCFQAAADIIMQIERQEIAWPSVLLTWRQTHHLKPVSRLGS